MMPRSENLHPYLSVLNLFAVIAVLLSNSCGSPAGELTADTSSHPPNFIIIFADDLGYGDLSTYGHPTIHTPHLDQMAVEGQKWTNFYVGASVCTPSRAALLTGRLPIRSGMAGVRERVLFPNSANGLPQGEITLAEQLKEAGYTTGMVGKWHLGHKPESLPTTQGFDFYYGIPYSNDMNITRELNASTTYWDLWIREYKNLHSRDFNVPLLKGTKEVERPADQTTLTRRYTEEAIRWIRENKDTTFFMYLAHNLPHVPLFASDDFKGKSKRGLYGDVVEEIDFGVGQILEMLKSEGLSENTIVLFTSDNGPWLTTELSGGSAGLLRGGKGSTWEGGFREPAIFWGPGNVVPKLVSDMGTTMDVFTTFSKLAGLDLPQDRELDGLDLSPVLLGSGESPRKEVIYYRNREIFAFRLGAYKAHFQTRDGYRSSGPELHDPPLLFNVEEDPSERFNIAESHPEILEKIREAVQKHREALVPGPHVLDQRGPEHRIEKYE